MAMRRDELHELLDGVPEADIPTIRRILIALQPSHLPRQLANAPLDDEPTSPDEALAVQQSLEAKANGDVHTAEEARRLLLG